MVVVVVGMVGMVGMVIIIQHRRRTTSGYLVTRYPRSNNWLDKRCQILFGFARHTLSSMDPKSSTHKISCDWRGASSTFGCHRCCLLIPRLSAAPLTKLVDLMSSWSVNNYITLTKTSTYVKSVPTGNIFKNCQVMPRFCKSTFKLNTVHLFTNKNIPCPETNIFHQWK